MAAFRIAGGGFFFDGREGAEEKVGGVGHDGAAARGDAVLCEEQQEARKELVDGRGGGEFVESASEGGGEVGRASCRERVFRVV